MQPYNTSLARPTTRMSPMTRGPAAGQHDAIIDASGHHNLDDVVSCGLYISTIGKPDLTGFFSHRSVASHQVSHLSGEQNIYGI